MTVDTLSGRTRKYKVFTKVRRGGFLSDPYAPHQEISVVIEARSGSEAIDLAFEQTFKTLGFTKDQFSWQRLGPTEADKDDAIGQAARNGFYKGRADLMPGGWPSLEKRQQQWWIDAGKAARELDVENL